MATATATRPKDDKKARRKDAERAQVKDAERAAKAKEKENAAKAKEKEKAAKAKEKERVAKAKEKEKAAKAKEKERAAKAKEKERAAKAKEKEKAAKAREKEKAAKAKEKQKAAAKAKEKAATKKDGRAGTGPKSRGGSTGPARRPSRDGSPSPTVHEAGWVAEELGKGGAVTRSTKRPTLAASFTTRDHDVIRRWAESRGGVPADVRGTGDGNDTGGAGVLRIEFRDETDRLEDVSWDAFFATFDDSDVDFLYQEYTKDGGESRFHKIVRADA
jgi:hypothetical protein